MAVLNGTRRITTHEAQLKTAAVEVKALTISGKQVTLSVFRQLQEEELLDRETAQLRGVPWGHVNYYWGECKADHLHVVWQKGEELRRACVWRAAPERSGPLCKLLERLFILAGYYISWRVVRADEGYRSAGGGLLPEEQRTVAYGQDSSVTVGVPKWLEELYGFTWHMRELAQQHGPDSLNDKYYQTEMQREQARWDALMERAGRFLSDMQDRGWTSPEHILSGIQKTGQRMEAFRTAWAQQYDALAALDQLFIAV